MATYVYAQCVSNCVSRSDTCCHATWLTHRTTHLYTQCSTHLLITARASLSPRGLWGACASMAPVLRPNLFAHPMGKACAYTCSTAGRSVSPSLGYRLGTQLAIQWFARWPPRLVRCGCASLHARFTPRLLVSGRADGGLCRAICGDPRMDVHEASHIDAQHVVSSHTYGGIYVGPHACTHRCAYRGLHVDRRVAMSAQTDTVSDWRTHLPVSADRSWRIDPLPDERPRVFVKRWASTNANGRVSLRACYVIYHPAHGGPSMEPYRSPCLARSSYSGKVLCVSAHPVLGGLSCVLDALCVHPQGQLAPNLSPSKSFTRVVDGVAGDGPSKYARWHCGGRANQVTSALTHVAAWEATSVGVRKQPCSVPRQPPYVLRRVTRSWRVRWRTGVRLPWRPSRRADTKAKWVIS